MTPEFSDRQKYVLLLIQLKALELRWVKRIGAYKVRSDLEEVIPKKLSLGGKINSIQDCLNGLRQIIYGQPNQKPLPPPQKPPQHQG